MKNAIPALLILVLAACATQGKAPPAPAPSPPLVLSLDESDIAILDRTLQLAAARPPGRPQHWTNPANGKEGSLTVIRRGYTRTGRHCGEIHLDARLHGRRAQDVTVVCEGSDGRWHPEEGFSVAG